MNEMVAVVFLHNVQEENLSQQNYAILQYLISVCHYLLQLAATKLCPVFTPLMALLLTGLAKKCTGQMEATT